MSLDPASVEEPNSGLQPPLHKRIVDPSSSASLSYRARARRWRKLLAVFPRIAEWRVVDLGGTPSAWLHAPVRPLSVTLVNTQPPSEAVPPWMTIVEGDACAYASDERFDLCYSNSLIEHLGGHRQRQRVGAVIDAIAAHHWVQTPYRYFPIEPHWVFPGFQFLPFRARVEVARRWRFGHVPARGRAQAVEDVAETELLSITEMKAYFPASEIWIERLWGMPKSLVAFR